MSMKRSLLIVLALLGVAAIAAVLPLAMRHARAAAKSSAAMRPPASQSNAHPAPIRFVKNPEPAPGIEIANIPAKRFPPPVGVARWCCWRFGRPGARCAARKSPR